MMVFRMKSKAQKILMAMVYQITVTRIQIMTESSMPPKMRFVPEQHLAFLQIQTVIPFQITKIWILMTTINPINLKAKQITMEIMTLIILIQIVMEILLMISMINVHCYQVLTAIMDVLLTLMQMVFTTLMIQMMIMMVLWIPWRQEFVPLLMLIVILMAMASRIAQIQTVIMTVFLTLENQMVRM